MDLTTKRQMMLEERYATLMVQARDIYEQCQHLDASDRAKAEQDLPLVLRSISTEMSEIEDEIGERIRMLYGGREKWWIR